jgi:hypothetical protein
MNALCRNILMSDVVWEKKALSQPSQENRLAEDDWRDELFFMRLVGRTLFIMNNGIKRGIAMRPENRRAS